MHKPIKVQMLEDFISVIAEIWKSGAYMAGQGSLNVADAKKVIDTVVSTLQVIAL